MNRNRLDLHSGIKGVDVHVNDPTGPYYLVEDVHHLLRRVQQQRFHTAQCRCWDCETLQKDIAATLGESPAPETGCARCGGSGLLSPAPDITPTKCPDCNQPGRATANR